MSALGLRILLIPYGLVISIELSVKSSKESIEIVSFLKTGNKVVEDTFARKMIAYLLKNHVASR
jgi:hypothetical protein